MKIIVNLLLIKIKLHNIMKKRQILLSFLVAIVGFGIILASLKYDIQNYVPRNSKEFGLIKNHGIAGALEWLAKIRNNLQTGTVDRADWLKALKDVQSFGMKNNKSLDIEWSELGPDNVGGRTRAILIDKNNPNIIYAGGVSGGLWKSVTGGSSWVKVPSVGGVALESICISSIAQSADGDIYVATGEGGILQGFAQGHPFNTGFNGYGVYKSTDGGNTFSLLTSTVNSTAWNNIDNVSDIACDPVDTGRVYAATNSGIRVSDDGGYTWTNAFTFNNGNSTDIDIMSNGTVVVCINFKCYVSSTGDAGSFEQRMTGLPLYTGGLARYEFAVSPTDTNYIYACVAGSSGALAGIYRSVDKGVSWSLIGPGGSENFYLFGTNNQGYYDNEIAIFPDDPDKILVGGLDVWMGEKVNETGYYNWTQLSEWMDETTKYYVHADIHKIIFRPDNADIFYVGSDGGINRSVDGGKTFQTLNKNYNVTQFYSVACSSTGEVMGGTQDNGSIYINYKGNTEKNGTTVMGGDGGYCAFSVINPDAVFTTMYYGLVGRSSDKGKNYKYFGINPEGDDIVGHCAFVTPIALWESLNDVNSPDYVYFVADADYLAADTVKVYSNNSRWFYYILTDDIDKDDSVQVQDIIQAKYYVGCDGYIYMTRGALDFSGVPDWYKIANVSGTVQTMAVSKDGNYLFASTDNVLYRISNLSLAYDEASASVSSSYCVLETKNIYTVASYQTITSIAVDPNDANNVVITVGNYGYDNYVYYSTDALDSTVTFSTRQGNLPDVPVYSSVIEMNNPNVVLVGTEYGVYATEDISDISPVWTEENTGLDRVPVYRLIQQVNEYNSETFMTIDESGGVIDTVYVTYPAVTNNGVIYAGTHGRGFFKCEKYMGIEKDKTNVVLNMSSLNVYPNPVNTFTNVSFELKDKSSVLLRVFDLNGRIVKVSDLREKPAGKHKITVDCNTLPNGTYIVQLTTGKQSISSKIIVAK